MISFDPRPKPAAGEMALHVACCIEDQPEKEANAANAKTRKSNSDFEINHDTSKPINTERNTRKTTQQNNATKQNQAMQKKNYPSTNQPNKQTNKQTSKQANKQTNKHVPITHTHQKISSGDIPNSSTLFRNLTPRSPCGTVTEPLQNPSAGPRRNLAGPCALWNLTSEPPRTTSPRRTLRNPAPSRNENLPQLCGTLPTFLEAYT